MRVFLNIFGEAYNLNEAWNDLSYSKGVQKKSLDMKSQLGCVEVARQVESSTCPCLSQAQTSIHRSLRNISTFSLVTSNLTTVASTVCTLTQLGASIPVLEKS